MKESDSIALQHLLASINLELIHTLANTATLKANTASYNAMTQKMSNWQNTLRIISKKIASHQSGQQLRQKNIHSLPKDLRYREKQSINSNMQHIATLKQKIKQIELSLLNLLSNLLVPSESEVLFNAVNQLKSLHDWHQKLIKIKTIISITDSSDATVLIQEIKPLQRNQQTKNTRSNSTSIVPIDSMLLMLVIIMMLVKTAIKKNNG